MEFFEFVFLISVVILVFNFIWNIVIGIPVAIVLSIFRAGSLSFISRAIGAFITAALAALVAQRIFEKTDSGLFEAFIAITGAAILLMGFAGGIFQKRRDARENYDFEAMAQQEKESWVDSLIIFGGPLFFIAAVAIPELVQIGILNSTLDTIYDIVDIPVLGWVIAFIALFITLGTILQLMFFLLVAGGGTLVYLSNSFRGKKDKELKNIRFTSLEMKTFVKGLIAHAAADGELHEAEIKQIQETYHELIGVPISAITIESTFKRMVKTEYSFSNELTKLRPILSDEMKRNIISGSYLVSVADGKFHDKEKVLLSEVSTALKLTEAETKAIIKEIKKSL